VTNRDIKLYFETYQSNSYNHKNGEEVLVFTTDPWDDNFSYETLFHVCFRETDGTSYYIGDVKIFTSKGDITREVVKLDSYFQNLDETFYSLGQSLDYYRRLKIYLDDCHEDVLSRIRDIAINNKRLEELKSNHWGGYRNSLIRESTASSALNKVSMETNIYYSFTFENIIDDSSIQKCSFDFSKSKHLPYRINAIIGKNAAGKTKYLSSLAKCLHSRKSIDSDKFKVSPLEEKYRDNMVEKDYLGFLGFTNYIAVSFNAFDDFYQPPQKAMLTFEELINQLKYYFCSNEEDIKQFIQEKHLSEEAIKKYEQYIEIGDNLKQMNATNEKIFLSSNIESYKYIGLRQGNIINSDYYLYSELLNALRMIHIYDYYHKDEKDYIYKFDVLERIIYQVLFYEDDVKAGKFFKNIKVIYEKIESKYSINQEKVSFDNSLISELQTIIKQMSSGQNMIFYIYLNIIANITESSLLLIDEPETHLHPNAISIFVRFLNEILNLYSSFAIITTHSPLIIHEIPSSHISVFKNINGNHYADKIVMETFGANISDIVYDVFFIRENESNYQKYLKNFVEKGMKYDQILKLFKNNLSFDAKLFLKNLYKKHGDSND
jgi:Predicted ATP-dependent endonuclease of the OLD family